MFKLGVVESRRFGKIIILFESSVAPHPSRRVLRDALNGGRCSRGLDDLLMRFLSHCGREFIRSSRIKLRRVTVPKCPLRTRSPYLGSFNGEALLRFANSQVANTLYTVHNRRAIRGVVIGYRARAGSCDLKYAP
jgi:hypothetical protein